ncbi:MAG: orotidine-5'-phosphate decarboxylase [Caulobacteraceae bacterium]|nr:orotidine-5'-phosphate decarboxylase [Caulobacteraceae bacterium]
MPAAELVRQDQTQAVKADPRLIIPLDLPTRADAEAMVERLGDAVGFYKIGLQLLAGGGMDMARDLKRRGRQVFLDWKLHDIGATVEKATAAIVATGSCDVLTVHAEPQVMAAAARGRAGALGVKIVGVTVLTSLNDADLKDLGYGLGVEALVERRIRQAIDAGLDGVVASPHEAALARRIGGPDFLVITPGVRPGWAKADDQARAATPAEALAAGASHLVCGRPITAANDPRAAALAVTQEIAGI